MWNFLNQPYPFEANIRKQIRTNIFIGVFVAAFLIIFQPFNTNLWITEYKSFKLLGYGFVSFLMPTLLYLALTKINNPEVLEQKWNVWKEALMYFLILLSITFGNTIYSAFLFHINFSLKGFLGFFVTVILLGAFPIFAGIVLKYNRFKKLNEKEAEVMEDNLHSFQDKSSVSENTILLVAENEKDSIELNINDLIYIESADNYSNVVFLKEDKIQKMLLRGALKRFENQINQPSILRCHRSFIVNLNHVEHISGNAQGYRLSLKNMNDNIPVARNYGAIILERLKN